MDLLEAILGPLAAAVFITLVGWLNYKLNLRNTGVSVAVSYKSTITSMIASLKTLRDNFPMKGKLLSALPDTAIYDYRREDWFEVHRSLSEKLGHLYYIDESDGREVNEEIIRFFHKLKISRDVYATVILLSKARACAAANSERLGESTDQIGRELDKQSKQLMDMIDDLIVFGSKVQEDLERLLKHLDKGWLARTRRGLRRVLLPDQA